MECGLYTYQSTFLSNFEGNCTKESMGNLVEHFFRKSYTNSEIQSAVEVVVDKTISVSLFKKNFLRRIYIELEQQMTMKMQ